MRAAQPLACAELGAFESLSKTRIHTHTYTHTKDRRKDEAAGSVGQAPKWPPAAIIKNQRAPHPQPTFWVLCRPKINPAASWELFLKSSFSGVSDEQEHLWVVFRLRECCRRANSCPSPMVSVCHRPLRAIGLGYGDNDWERRG